MTDTERLFSLLTALPPNLTEIEEELKSKNYSSQDVTLAACRFCEECFLEYTDFIEFHKREPLEHEIHTSYVYDICSLLLKYGLDPNLVLGEKHSSTNIMYEVYWITKPYVAADTLRLLLAHGGDPMLMFEGEQLYYMVDFDVWFDVDERCYNKDWYKIKFDCRFHCWLVLHSAVSEEESIEKDYINHENYVPFITETDNGKLEIGATKKL